MNSVNLMLTDSFHFHAVYLREYFFIPRSLRSIAKQAASVDGEFIARLRNWNPVQYDPGLFAARKR